MNPKLTFSRFPNPNSFDQILTFPLTFYSFMFLVPYRLKFNEIENSYKPSSSIIQKVVCGAIYLVKTFQIADEKIRTIQDLVENDTHQRSRIFSILQIIPEICIPLIIAWFTFKCQRQFCRLANELRTLACDHSTNLNIMDNHFFISKPLIAICLLCLVPIISTSISLGPEMLMYENVLYSGAKFVLKAYREGPFHHSLIYFPLKYAFMAFIYLTQMVNSMFETYGVLILLCILIHVKRFQECIRNTDDMDQLYLLFGNLRRFIKFCNEGLAMNAFILVSFIDFIFGYSELSEKILFSGDRGANASQGTQLTLQFIFHLPFLLMALSTWAMSAEINRMISNSMSGWIERHQLKPELSTHDRVKLLGIGNEFDRQAVGISCQFFTVTYSFISSMVGLLLTFIMIANQSSHHDGGGNNGRTPAM